MDRQRGGELPYEDRLKAVERFRELLEPRFLRRYLTSELERLVARCESSDGAVRSRVEDHELPDLLLDLHGAEILREREIREALLQSVSKETLTRLLQASEHREPRSLKDALNQVVERTWRPGKRWPQKFVQIMELPLALAGEADGGVGPAIEELEPYVTLPELHDFQKELRDRLLEMIVRPEEGPRGILSLPTGAGKTRTVVEALVQALRKRTMPDGYVLWVAQSEELCEQAVLAFREVWMAQTVEAAASKDPDPADAGLPLCRLWASRSLPEPTDRAVVIASIQKLKACSEKQSEDFDDFLARVRVVVVDEAHHAIAATYTELFRKLEFKGRSGNRTLVGLTATPYRGSDRETGRLINRFSGNLITPPWTNAVKVLRERRILAGTEVERVETRRRFSLDMKELASWRKFSDLPESTLRRIGNDIERNRQILHRLLAFGPGSPVLFFACSVTHARAMALLLRRQGRSAAAVTAETPRSLRRTWIQDFKDGGTQFLCNYGILTTGFDAPKVEAVVIGRPTSSVLLYEQMVGRGMRGPANGGKEKCIVVDLVDIFPQFGEQMSYDRYRELWQEFSRRRSLS